LEFSVSFGVCIVFNFNAEASRAPQFAVQVFDLGCRKIPRDNHSVSLPVHESWNRDANCGYVAAGRTQVGGELRKLCNDVLRCDIHVAPFADLAVVVD